MARPWRTLDKVNTKEGVLELRKRGERDFLILINNRVLMNSSLNRSEIVLGARACTLVAGLSAPRVLIGGLGMGLTLRAALDALPVGAQVLVADLNPVMAAWCRGPLADLTQGAVDDSRVALVVDDVAAIIGRAAGPGAEKFDAVIIDLYEGPGASSDALLDPFYGLRALKTTAAALSPGGVFAVWGESSDAAFEMRLAAAGFTIDRQRPGRGGLRHVVYVAETAGKG